MDKTQPPKIAYFFMKIFLKLRRNPKKINEMLKSAGVKKGMKVLDYGCGIGSYAFEAAKIVGGSGKVVAADINEDMLKTVEKEIADTGMSNVYMQKVGTLQDIREKDFDIILLLDVLHLMGDKLIIIENFLAQLTENGKLLIKFEHMGDREIKELLSKSGCSAKRNIIKDFWLLGK